MSAMTVDRAVDLIFERLCQEVRARGAEAEVRTAALRLELGIPDEVFDAAVTVLKRAGEEAIVFPAPDRIRLGPGWRRRCEDAWRGQAPEPSGVEPETAANTPDRLLVGLIVLAVVMVVAAALLIGYWFG